MTEQKDSSPERAELRVLHFMGAFIALFGILLFIPAATEKSLSGRVTDLVSGITLLAVGGGMFARGIVRYRALWFRPLVLFVALALVSAVIAFLVTPRPAREKTKRPAEAKTIEEEKAGEETPTQQKPSESEESSSFVSALRRVGSAMRGVVETISLGYVKIFTAIGFLVIAAVTWLVRRETVFDPTTGRKWWRDLRLWTALIMASLIVTYLLLGT